MKLVWAAKKGEAALTGLLFIAAMALGFFGIKWITTDRGIKFEDLPSAQANQFAAFIKDVEHRTGWDVPKYWRVSGRRAEKQGTLCGQKSWAFSEQGLWCIGLTVGDSDEMRTILAVAPDQSYNLSALYHEALQGMGYANGKIPDNDDHPREFIQFIPPEYRCGWR